MKLTKWPLALLAAAALFSTGYVAGQSTSPVISTLDKQPASMLTVGLAVANLSLAPRSVTVQGDKLVVTHTTHIRGSNRPTATECAVALENARSALGAGAARGGARERSTFNLVFLPPQERSSQAPSVLARRDAIDAATLVRVLYEPDLGKAYGCEGPLLGSGATPF
jgi:hypothetical protein